MFNAVNILEALKNYIHTRGGTSNAYNIAEAVNDLNSIPQGSGGGIPEAPIDNKQYARKNGDWSEVESSGGDIPPEVSNAVETHGMGWTSEEEVEGFDIQWDGNTEGLESLFGQFFKISDKVYTEDELVGANGEYIMDDIVCKGIVSLFIPETDNEDSVPICFYDIHGDVPETFTANQAIVVVLEDAEFETEEGVMILHKGIYFSTPTEGYHTSRLYKEASTEEVVHQIDQKYIPQGQGGGGIVVHFNVDNEGNVTANYTPSELKNAMLSAPVSAVIYFMGETLYAYVCSFYNPDSGNPAQLRVFVCSNDGTGDVPMALVREKRNTDDWIFGA